MVQPVNRESHVSAQSSASKVTRKPTSHRLPAALPMTLPCELADDNYLERSCCLTR